jgi:hypothetical protein
MLASSSPMEGADELGRDRRHGRVTEKFGSRRRFPLRLPDERRSGQAYVPGTEWRTQGMHDATSQVIGGDTAGPTCLSNLDYCRRRSRSPNQRLRRNCRRCRKQCRGSCG